MRSAHLLILALLFPSVLLADDSPTLLQQAEQHYRMREDKDQLLLAIDFFQKALEVDPKNYEAAWKLSKAYWYLGNHSDKKIWDGFFKKGIEAAEKAVMIDPNQCEGYFWLGVNFGTYGEAAGPFTALGLIDDIKEAMKRTSLINEDCQCGGPQRVLGRLYHKAPWFKGGSKKKALDFYTRSKELCPDDTQTPLFLAEMLIEEEQYESAKKELEYVLSRDPDPEWIPETKENKIRASQLLSELEKGGK